jgi:putative hydrolase of the HAD superfamily
MIRLITIDCWDTVIRNNAVWDDRLVDIAYAAFRTAQSDIDRQTVVAAFSAEDAAFSRTLRDDMITPILMSRLQALAAFAQVSMSESALLQLQTAVESAILSPLPELMPGVQRFLSNVKNRELKVCLVCNTGWFTSRAIDAALQRCGVFQFFDFFAYSDRVGSAKPSTRIFEFALSIAGCRPDEAVHIGDKVTTDVIGAQKAGLCAVHYHPGGPCADAAILCACDYDELWAMLVARLTAKC